MMKRPAPMDTIRVAFTRQGRISGWSGRWLIQAIFLSSALAAWLSLPGHEKASHVLSALHRLRSSSSFNFPVLDACGFGFVIAAIAAALTPIILNLAGIAPYENGAGLLASGGAMWFAARFLHAAQH